MKLFFATILSLILTSISAFAQETKTIIPAESSISWTGKKVTGSHNGQIDIREGALLFDNGQISGGSFIIDMTSLTNEDLGGEMKGKLEGHLKSDDFFGVTTYPEAKLVITDVTPLGGSYKINGDLTIKGKTAPVSFDASISGNKATANITVDRTIYDVRYGSGKFFENLGDKMIYDNFDLEVNLVF